jgi:hypothetical protein
MNIRAAAKDKESRPIKYLSRAHAVALTAAMQMGKSMERHLLKDVAASLCVHDRGIRIPFH